MASVYSTTFLRSHGGAGGSYTVPTGYRAVIRTVTIFCGTSVTADSGAVILGHSSCTIVQGNFLTGVDANNFHSQVWDMRVVVEAEDTIQVSNSANVDVTVSGYLLTDDGP